MELLAYSAISLLFTKYFTPIQLPKAWVIEKITRWYVKREWYWMFEVVKVLTCPKCFSLWFTLVVTQNIFSAAIVSVLTMLIDSTLNYLNENGDN